MSLKIGCAVCVLLSYFLAMGLTQARTLALASNDPMSSTASASARLEGVRLMREAKVHEVAQRYEEALHTYEQALDLRERDPFQVADAAVSAYRVGVMHRLLMQFAEAQTSFQRALALDKKAYGRNHLEVATDLSALAGIYYRRGRFDDALQTNQRALSIRQQQLGGEHPAVAATLDAQVSILVDMGHYAEALGAARRALDIREAHFGGNHWSVAESLDTLAGIYRTLGRFADSLPLYERALAIREMINGADSTNTALALNNLANDLDEIGRKNEAIAFYQRALAIWEKNGLAESLGSATAMSNLAYTYRDTGRFAEALPLFQHSLSIKEQRLGPFHSDVARVLRHIGVGYLANAKPDDAQPYLERALLIMLQQGDTFPVLLSQVQESVADLYQMQMQPEMAILYGKQAINTLQAVRAVNTSLDKESQKGFLQKNESSYKRLADHLLEAGRIPEAQQVIAMLKEAEYFDFIQRNSAADPRKTQASFDGKELPWANRYVEISGQLASLSKEREGLIKKAQTGLSVEEQSRKDILDADLAVARQAYDAYMVDLKREFTQSASAGRSKDERIEELGSKNLASLRALQGTLRDLGHGAVTLHYLMADKRLWILLTTPNIQIKREALISEAELNKKIGAYREAISLRDPKVNELGKKLYDIIIGPVADDLRQAGAQTLMLSLDGGLRYLPMAALYDGEKYLIQRYRLAIYTAASTSQLIVPPKADWSMAGFGTTHAITVPAHGTWEELNFKALTSVKGELEGIQLDMKGPVKLDQDFTAKSLQEGLEAGASVVHLASHFIFTPGNETDSFLLMGDGSPLSLAAIRNFEFTRVDLLTLSACETAVGGGKDANGREVEGFGVQAQEQGAKAVVATLWPVADQSTGQFMQLLYGYRQKNPGMTKAESMQKAQLAFIEGRVGAALEDLSRSPAKPEVINRSTAVTSTNHPYFWAPFILMGNWL